MTESARTELTMIDRVAMAIASSLDDGRYYNSISFQNAARAALRAMREPTDLMIEAGLAANVRAHKTMQDVLEYDNEGGALEKAFPAMIDAALQWPAGSADRAGVPVAED